MAMINDDKKSYKVTLNLESKKFYPYLYVIPALIFFAVYIFYPLIFSTGLSFFKWDGFRSIFQAEFIGVQNFIDLVHDKLFWLSLKNTFYFVGGALVLQNVFGASLALVLFYARIRGSKFWRALIFFPAVLSPVIIGLIWRLIFAKNGLLNEALAGLGLGSLQTLWLGNKVTPIWCITWVNIWQWSGYNMVIYYAGLQSIPEELLDAAKVDGASWKNIIFRIVLPLLGGAASIAMVLNIIGGFKVFDLIYVLTRGGPAHYSEVLTSYMFHQSFALNGPSEMGYASSLALVLTVIIFVLALIRIRTSKTIEF
jgi:raffinose/stachyose/melibiose transport system permease protein